MAPRRGEQGSARSETGSCASQSMRRHILVECDHLLGIFVDLVGGDLAPGDFAEDHALVGIDDGSVCRGTSVCKPQANGGIPRWSHDEDLMWFESQADLVDTPHPPLDLLSASKLPCPGVVSGENEPDVVGIGAEKRLKVALAKAAQGTIEHGSYCPCIQCGEQAEHDGHRQCHDERGRWAAEALFARLFGMN